MSKQSVPGPGQYKTIEMSGVGKYPLQRMKNSGAACWSPPSSKRFADESRLGGNLPHHSTYTPDDTSNGTYLLSQQKSYHVPKIGPSFGPIKQIDDRKTKAEERKKRTCKFRIFQKSPNDVETPGPGSYTLPSEFGVVNRRSSINDRNHTPSGLQLRMQYNSEI